MSYPFAEKICAVKGCNRWAIHGEELCGVCDEAQEEGKRLPRKFPRAYNAAQYTQARQTNKETARERVAAIVAEVMEASRLRRTKKCPDCGASYLGKKRRCESCAAKARGYYRDHRNDARAAMRAEKRDAS